MSALESKIDDLYRARLASFTSERNALAKTLGGDEAKQVKKLAKPTVVPWAVNQVYWHARRLYDALLKSGVQLRTAQVAALEGKKADVRAAGEAHRKAIADAVNEAERFAHVDGAKPGRDALMRTFEALSLSAEHPEAPGRLTRELVPAGFEALAGVTPAAVARPSRAEPSPEERKKAESAKKKAEADQRKRDADVRKAEAAVERARAKMRAAEQALKTARNH